MSPERGEGILFVIAAPSGTGKSTVARGVLERLSGIGFSISHTTRSPRAGEIDGKHYHFVDRAAFETMQEEGAFLESAEVYGNLYGTGLAAVREALSTGNDLLLDIDVQGARQVTSGPIDAVTIMILPPDYRTLRSRLEGRGSENPDDLRRRLSKARAELEAYRSFQYTVVNRRVDTAVRDVCAIVRAERVRTSRRSEEATRVVATFPGGDSHAG